MVRSNQIKPDNDTKPNVLLVILDSVRAKNTSLYGHFNETTPFLEDFGRNSTVYQQARSPGINSISSHISIFTGYHVHQHGITSEVKQIKPGETIWEELSEELGYSTAVFSENPYLTTSVIGLSDVFSEVYDNRLLFRGAADPREHLDDSRSPDYNSFLKAAIRKRAFLRSIGNAISMQLENRMLGMPWVRNTNSAATTISTFLDWTESISTPWAACVNLMDAHSPYKIPDKYNRWGGKDIYDIQSRSQPNYLQFIADGGWELQALESLYDGAIRKLDDRLRTLIKTLSTTKQLENTLLVITADHGENFGERSFTRPNTRLAGHTAGIDENLLHVPLICSFPHGQRDDNTINEPVSLVEFPLVVRECISGSVNADAFQSDKPVVAYSTRESAPGPESERYIGTARTVYENPDSRGVNKHCEWGNSTQQVHIDDAQTAYPLQSEGIEIQTVFDSFGQVNVSKEGRDEPIEETVEHRLRHLGYRE